MFTFAIAYLSIPVLLVLFSFFNTLFVLTSTVAIVILVFCLCKSQLEKKNNGFCYKAIVNYWPLFLISIAVTYLCVVSPFKIWDWEKHFAVLNILVESSWPPTVKLNEQTWFLRYYLAWYVVPSLFAKVFESQLLTFFMFIWTATGVFTTLFLAFSYLRKTSHLFIAVSVFFLFSGLDIIGCWLNDYTPSPFPHWPQIWAGWGEIWPALTSIAWAPQHVVGGWVGSCLFLYNRSLAVRYGAVIVAVVSLWSPFCAVGLIPIVTWATIKEGYKTALTPQNLLTAPFIAIPVALYLLQGSGQVPLMFVWEHRDFSIAVFLIFCTLEFALIIGILYPSRKIERSLLITIGFFLFFLCLIRFGILNDLLMRGSISAICILSALVVKVLINSRDKYREVIVVYLIIGALPVVVAFAKGLSEEKVDRKMNFEKLTSLYTYEEHPYMTYSYLVKTGNMVKVFDIPLLRNISDNEVHGGG